MSNAAISPSQKWFRAKYAAFAFIGAMMAYVLYHNESFLIEPANPIWKHYQAFGVFLLVHGVAGACAMILAPMQFSDRLRARFTRLHRVAGRIYVTAAVVLAPFGVTVQYIDERMGLFPRSFTVETVIQASLMAITALIGFAFALKRMIPQHRQWMTRSYAVALVFFEVRVILGVTGWDNSPVMIETVVWSCTALALLAGDIANQIHDLGSMRPRAARAQSARAVAAE